MIYPAIVALVTLIFTWQVFGDFRKRRKPYQASWSAALAMSAAGSIGYLAAAAWGSPFAFRVYYLFGAMLSAAYMGMGSLFLVLGGGAARRVLQALVAVSIVGAALLFSAPVDTEALATLGGASGRGVITSGLWLAFMIGLNFFGTFGVVGVALYSAWRSLSGKGDGRFFLGNLVIGIGFLLVAAAGSAARWWPDWDGGFWTVMALGWAIAYGGFREISRVLEAGRQGARS